MLGLRSLRNRLAVVFGLIVFGAVGTIYLTVTPRLEERLQEQKLDRLQADARTQRRRQDRLRRGLRARHRALARGPRAAGDARQRRGGRAPAPRC